MHLTPSASLRVCFLYLVLLRSKTLHSTLQLVNKCFVNKWRNELHTFQDNFAIPYRFFLLFLYYFTANTLGFSFKSIPVLFVMRHVMTLETFTFKTSFFCWDKNELFLFSRLIADGVFTWGQFVTQDFWSSGFQIVSSNPAFVWLWLMSVTVKASLWHPLVTKCLFWARLLSSLTPYKGAT